MKKNKKSMILLIITIFFVVMAVGIATYAYYSAKEIYGGSFDVDIESKGVDTFDMKASKDISFLANEENFSYEEGADVSGSAYVDVSLNTTKKAAKYCYEVNFKMPDEEVLEYSNYPNPEIVLDFDRIENGQKTSIIKKMDVTKKTGTLKIPTSEDENNYKHQITATKNNPVRVRWQATLTLVYYKDVNQNLNRYKTYNTSIKVNIVEC